MSQESTQDHTFSSDFWILCAIESINQSIEQSIKQSINQSIDQSINRSINQSIKRSTTESINGSMDQSINQSTWKICLDNLDQKKIVKKLFFSPRPSAKFCPASERSWNCACPRSLAPVPGYALRSAAIPSAPWRRSAPATTLCWQFYRAARESSCWAGRGCRAANWRSCSRRFAGVPPPRAPPRWPRHSPSPTRDHATTPLHFPHRRASCHNRRRSRPWDCCCGCSAAWSLHAVLVGLLWWWGWEGATPAPVWKVIGLAKVTVAAVKRKRKRKQTASEKSCRRKTVQTRFFLPLASKRNEMIREKTIKWFVKRLINRGEERRPGLSNTIIPSNNQSINQSINKQFNTSIEQSINQSINQPNNRSINQSIDQSINQSINQSTKQSINQPINQSIDQSINQSINRMKMCNFSNFD